MILLAVILRSGTTAILALIVANLAMIGVAVANYPKFFSQPGARVVLVESVSGLVGYAVAAVWVGRARGPHWDSIVRTSTMFGLFGGIVEVLNIGIENGFPVDIHAPALPIAFMLTIFASWGVAGFRTTRALKTIRAGLLSAVTSAGICMLIAVTAGFVIQFFVARPEPAYISTWAEFKRSGWTDARAFGLVNTLDSGLTHLVIAPVVALVFGGVASFFAQFGHPKETSTTPQGRLES